MSGAAGAGPAGRLWGSRLGSAPDEAAWELGRSVDVDARLAAYDIAGSRAHARQLRRIGVLDEAECDRLIGALDDCLAELEDGAFAFEPTDEDIHGAIERWLIDRLGPELGGKLRAGRSRNDQVASDLRLFARDAARRLVGRVGRLQSALCDQAEDHLDWLAPGYTHLQRGQPVLLSHHLLAHVWALQRDAGRLADAADRADESVLGAGALGGTTLDLDPAAYAEELGYDRVAANSMDAVSARDFAAELASAAAILAVTLSRLGEELVLWSTAELGFARLGDGFSTGSSIMPNKRNPDVPELVRGKAGRVIGDLVALLSTCKGLPLTYNRDLQEDKPPVFDAVDTLDLALPALTGAVSSLEFDRERLAEAAGAGDALATDLAEELVRRGVPFREAHEVVGRLVRRAEDAGTDLVGLDPGEIAAAHDALDRSVVELLDPEAAVRRRTGSLATGHDQVRAQLRRAREAAEQNR